MKKLLITIICISSLAITTAAQTWKIYSAGILAKQGKVETNAAKGSTLLKIGAIGMNFVNEVEMELIKKGEKDNIYDVMIVDDNDGEVLTKNDFAFNKKNKISIASFKPILKEKGKLHCFIVIKPKDKGKQATVRLKRIYLFTFSPKNQ
jgi:uncharacterized membrane protein YhiD involved in acid resistance